MALLYKIIGWIVAFIFIMIGVIDLINGDGTLGFVSILNGVIYGGLLFAVGMMLETLSNIEDVTLEAYTILKKITERRKP